MSGKSANIPIEKMFIDALKNVQYPGFEMDLVTMELIEEARLVGGKAVIKLRPVAAPPDVREKLENEIASAVSGLPGVKELELMMPQPAPLKEEVQGPTPIEGVKAIVPVASGKGGVGKSTVAANLALGLAKEGLKVGLLDLDLYGPSVPIMLGVKDAQPGSSGDKLEPIIAHGIKTVSIGYLMDNEKALIWRGPLIMKAVRQLLHQVDWAPLDVLVLDLPPGTGDVQISMAQEVPIAGAVVVTTPQDVALIDAVKGVDMFKAVKADVWGIIENMSYFVCDECQKRHEIFGNGSVKPLCEKLGVDYLGDLPLDTSIREASDQGTPAVLGSGPAAEAYQEIARKVKAKLG